MDEPLVDVVAILRDTSLTRRDRGRKIVTELRTSHPSMRAWTASTMWPIMTDSCSAPSRTRIPNRGCQPRLIHKLKAEARRECHPN